MSCQEENTIVQSIKVKKKEAAVKVEKPIDHDLGEHVKSTPFVNDSSRFGKHISNKKWKNLIQSADKVVAYNWNRNEHNSANTKHFMIRSSHIDQTAIKVHELNEVEKEKWTNLVTDTNNYRNLTPMCFTPHIAFLYYRNDTIIGQSNVCFLCTAIFSKPGDRLSLKEESTSEIKSFCRSLGLKIIDR